VEPARERAYSAIRSLGGLGWRFRSDIAALPPRSGVLAQEPAPAGNAGSA
jgi:hypothetical protein